MAFAMSGKTEAVLDPEIAAVLEIFSGAVNTVQRALYTERLTPTRSAG